MTLRGKRIVARSQSVQSDDHMIQCIATRKDLPETNTCGLSITRAELAPQLPALFLTSPSAAKVFIDFLYRHHLQPEHPPRLLQGREPILGMVQGPRPRRPDPARIAARIGLRRGAAAGSFRADRQATPCRAANAG